MPAGGGDPWLHVKDGWESARGGGRVGGFSPGALEETPLAPFREGQAVHGSWAVVWRVGRGQPGGCSCRRSGGCSGYCGRSGRERATVRKVGGGQVPAGFP